MSEGNQLVDEGEANELAKRPDENISDYVKRRQAVLDRRQLERLRVLETQKHLPPAAPGSGAPPASSPVEDDDRDNASTAPPSDPVAREKARREKRWAEEARADAREDELTRHWEEARIAEVDSRGGLAALTRDLPMDSGSWSLPRAPETDGPARYRKPDAPPDDAETELTAMIAECRHFMRGVAFESARMTPNAGDRLDFIDRACRLAEAGAKVGKSVAGLRGREANVREVLQRIRLEDGRRPEGDCA